MSQDQPGTAIVLDDSGTVLSADPINDLQPDDDINSLSDLGFIVPLGKATALRRAFAYKQRLYAAILDPNDYLYIVPYDDNNKKRQFVTAERAEALKFAETRGLTTVMAKPKKSGIVKLARALGIQAKCVLRQGLPSEPTANYSYAVYEARHERTGFQEEGVGWCDRSERGGRISTHDVIATADTRAYNRAILRLSGFGDISADEIVAGASYGDDSLGDNVPETTPAPQKKPAALPPPNDDSVITAARVWAEHVAQREGERFLPDAQQANKSYRELRALARRGDASAAQKMGVLGVQWRGPAQDSAGAMPFAVEDPPVKPEDIQAVRSAAAEAPPHDNGSSTIDMTKTSAPAKTEAAPGPAPTLSIPAPDMTAETITTAQARTISQLLLKIFSNSKPEAREWIKREATVAGAVFIRVNQYGPIVTALEKMSPAEKESARG